MDLKTLEPQTDDQITLARFMLENDRFTHADLDALKTSQSAKATFLSRLRSRGILRKVDAVGRCVVLTVLDQEAAQAFEAAKRQAPEGVMWAAIRVLKEFTPEDLMEVVGKTDDALDLDKIRTYCRWLAKAEYLKILETARPRVRSARYKLINDSGPMAPNVKNLRVVVDGNTGLSAYIEGAR